MTTTRDRGADSPTDEPSVTDVDEIAAVAKAQRLHIAVAESLTSGALASRLGAGSAAVEWFRGGVVAYDEAVKFDLLGVTPGPLVTEQCAREMATGVARLLAADVAVAVTGVGGPEPSEGHPAGTVVLAVTFAGSGTCRSFEFPGDPEDVISATVEAALEMLATTLRSRFPDAPDS